MRFLQTDSGEGLINAAHLVQIEDVKGEDASGSVAKLADGRSVSFYFNANMLEASLCPVIAAAPGFMLLQKYKNDDENRAPLRLAIVASRVDQHGIAYPVVAQEISDHIAVVAILQPDGQVIESGSLGGVYDDEAEWLADVKEREDEAIKNADAKP